MLEGMQDILTNMQFKKVDNLVWSMPDGNVGIKHSSGILSMNEQDETIERNPTDKFSFSLPAFAFSTKIEDVKKTDIIVENNGDILGWVIINNDGIFEILDTQGFTKTWKPIKTKMFGFENNGPMVVRSIMNLNGGSLDGTGFNQSNMMQMMMMQKMMGKGSSKFDSIVPFMALSGGFSSDNNGNNPMQMMMMQSMMNDDSDLSDLMPMMMMSGMSGGDNSNNSIMQMMMMQKMMEDKPVKEEIPFMDSNSMLNRHGRRKY